MCEKVPDIEELNNILLNSNIRSSNSFETVFTDETHPGKSASTRLVQSSGLWKCFFSIISRRVFRYGDERLKEGEKIRR